jgi:Fe-S cluster assembly scaffold protein SufB
MRTIIRVPDGYETKTPLHFCFILDKKGTKQAIQPTWYIGKYAKVKIFAYCFGLDFDVLHGDGKKYYLEEGAELEVYEFNYNETESYLTVYNNVYAELKDNAKFKNYYVSTVGHLGH